MAFAVKTDTRVRAWELGAETETEARMILQGKIVARPDGTYELFSLEATEGKGQVAKAGDFFKVDENGYPYPNEREYFLAHHRHLEEDWYEQATVPLKIWRKGDPVCEELRFLLDRGILSLHPEDPAHYFSAFLWDTRETSAEDSVVVFYAVDRNPDGAVTGVSFNFVVADYFRRHYRVIPS